MCHEYYINNNNSTYECMGIHPFLPLFKFFNQLQKSPFLTTINPRKGEEMAKLFISLVVIYYRDVIGKPNVLR
jgi:hypothetical protein